MAITPAVGPKPSTLTKINAQTNSGILLKIMSTSLNRYLRVAPKKSLLLSTYEVDNLLHISIAPGTATIKARVNPAVAIAIV